MRNIRKPWFWLWVFFFVVLSLRLFFAFQTKYMDYDAYFALRQIEHISKTGFPLFNDPLSYQGRTFLFTPAYYYFLAFFSLFMPLNIAVKLIPNILASSVIFIIYFFSYKITKNKNISLITSFLSVFIPVWFLDINTLTTDYFSIIIMFIILLLFLNLENKNHLNWSIFLLILLVFSSPLVFILVLGLLVYVAICRIEQKQVRTGRIEWVLFALFLSVWANLLIYKNALVNHGIRVIWKNLPQTVLREYFISLSFPQMFSYIGILPLILGVLAMYFAFHERKNKVVFLITAMASLIFILLFFTLIELKTGLLILSMLMVIASSFTLKIFYIYFTKTKISFIYRFMLIFFVGIFLLSSGFSSVKTARDSLSKTPTESEVDSLRWLQEHSNPAETTLITADKGYLLNYYSNTMNVADNNFLLMNDVETRLQDIRIIYTSRLESPAAEKLNYYGVDYIYLSDSIKDEFNIEDIVYTKDDLLCFDLLYQSNIGEPIIEIYGYGCGK